MRNRKENENIARMSAGEQIESVHSNTHTQSTTDDNKQMHTIPAGNI